VLNQLLEVALGQQFFERAVQVGFGVALNPAAARLQARITFPGDGAVDAILPLAELDADFAPEVLAARTLLERIEGAGASILGRGQKFQESGYFLRAEAFYTKVKGEFQGTPTGDLADQRLTSLLAGKDFRDARKHWRELEKIAKAAEKGKTVAELTLMFQQLDLNSASDGIRDCSQQLQRELVRDGHTAMLQRWHELLPASQLKLTLKDLTQS